MLWLLHFMQPNISSSYVLLATAHEILIAVSQTQPQVGNDAQVYEWVKKAHKTGQGERALAEYYVELRAVWQEIDYYEDY